jgi:hypothetical protein
MAKSRHTTDLLSAHGRFIEGNMKYFKILPTAASVIALTSVTCFAQDQREIEESVISITRVRVYSHSGTCADNPATVQPENRTGGHYLIEVDLGSKTKEVLIDARTGAVLRKREISSAIV